MILKPLLFIFNIRYEIYEFILGFSHMLFLDIFGGVRFASMAAFTISDRYPSIQFMVQACASGCYTLN
jgi:hypothetical protein